MRKPNLISCSFYEKRHSLALQDNVLLWGHRVVDPLKLHETLLSELHESHQGVVKMKSLARIFFLPGIDSCIEDFVKNCNV